MTLCAGNGSNQSTWPRPTAAIATANVARSMARTPSFKRRTAQKSHPTSNGKQSLLQCFAEELKQRLGGRIIGPAEVRVDLIVGGFLAAEERNGNTRVLQHIPQPLRLRARIRMIG